MNTYICKLLWYTYVYHMRGCGHTGRYIFTCNTHKQTAVRLHNNINNSWRKTFPSGISTKQRNRVIRCAHSVGVCTYKYCITTLSSLVYKLKVSNVSVVRSTSDQNAYIGYFWHSISKFTNTNITSPAI